MKPLLIDNVLTLFSGASYTQYNLETGLLLTPHARPIADGWAIPFPKIDAAVHWTTDTVYFLNDMQVIRYSLRTNRIDAGYPKLVPFYWRGLWASDIDAVLRIEQKAWFFRKNQCIDYDVTTGQINLSGPRPTTHFWPGLSEPVTGAVPISPDFVLFFSGGICRLYHQHQKRVVVGPLPFSELIQDGIQTHIEPVKSQKKPDSSPD